MTLRTPRSALPALGLAAVLAVSLAPPSAQAEESELVTVVATAVGAVSEQEVVEQASADADDVEVRTIADTSVVTIETTDPEGVIAGLEASGEYQGAALERYAEVYGFADPNDPYYRNGVQWDIGNPQGSNPWARAAAVGARFEAAWPLMATDAGAAARAPIAVIDSGLPASPSAQLAAVVGKYDVADGDANVRLPAGVSALDAIHGGYVSSVIAARTDDSSSIAGAAWDTSLYFYKVLSDQSAVQGNYLLAISDITVAVRRAVADGAKVINMSFGSTCPAQSQWATDPLALAIQDAVAAGVVVVAAAGNAGNGTVNCPASFPNVISVAATARNGDRAEFSEYNAYVDIAAPGEDVAAVSASGSSVAGEIKLVDGTSFSSPLVAAAAGLLKRTYPDLAPALVERVLLYTAQDTGTYGRDDYFGYGVLDAGAALAAGGRADSLADPYTTLVPHVQQLTLPGDMDGDGRGELLVVDGTQATLKGVVGSVKSKLLRFPATPAGGLGTVQQIGWNWSGFTVYGAGDWNRDGKADLLGRAGSGALYFYRGLGDGTLATAVRVGSGWVGYTAVPSRDLSGDGNPDLLAIQDSTGLLYLYRGDGRGGFLPGRTQVGSGWRGFRLFAPGDVTGDGRNDIISTGPDGALYRYPGTGSGGFGARVRIGGGWNMYKQVVMGLFDADQYVDIIALDPSNSGVYYYRGLGWSQFGARSQIAAGW
ncbi:MAG: S8 family serine peptidase [Bifidobacteriaceae bacterium]|jgi:hypothetical protein|nr:S8 family serine peptidase [Bifidobacteriaceae bacterium]